MKEAVPDYVGDVLAALIGELAVDPVDLGGRTLEVLRARSPELVRGSDKSGKDPLATAAGFMEMLLQSLQSDFNLRWKESDRTSREYGRARAAQGVPLETLIDELAVYRRATIELISGRLQDSPRRDEIVAYAQSHLEDVVERITAAVASGYLDGIVADNDAKRAESLQSSAEARNHLTTGLANRPLSMLTIGLDQLKKIKDYRTRRKGSGALKRVAQKLRRVSRVGGAKLSVASPDAEVDHARDVVRRIRDAGHRMSRGASARGQIAVSFGVAAWQSGCDWRAVHRNAGGDLDQDEHCHKAVRRRTGVPI
jgi:GGDEF domain-containing protein